MAIFDYLFLSRAVEYISNVFFLSGLIVCSIPSNVANIRAKFAYRSICYSSCEPSSWHFEFEIRYY